MSSYFDWRASEGSPRLRSFPALEKLTEGAEFVRVTPNGVILRLADGSLVEWAAGGYEFDMELEDA